MERARRRNVPPTPSNLRELNDMLGEYPIMKNLYKGIIEADDGSIALKFRDDEMMQALSQSKQIYCDGTYDVSRINVLMKREGE